MSSVIIREANISDLQALCVLVADLGYSASSEEIRKQFEIISKQPDQKIYVAERNRIVVGFMSFHYLDYIFAVNKIGRITSIVVNSEERGRGTGKLLIHKAEELAKATGCNKLELTSNNRRIEAHQFYERMGFEATSTRFVKVV